ncbi:SHOCT domain-containing protein [Candidatus Aerophobetes bacterium]|nr:SHOCT domain-containing protein [Candidatus Aerophobetes bacterium]
MIIPGVNLIWSIWWSYVLFRDPNIHFDTHLFWETQLERIITQHTPSPTETPLEILKRRYAEGKITREEFEQMKKDLLADQ